MSEKYKRIELMKLSSKLQKLVDQKLITLEQAEKIMKNEESSSFGLMGKLAYWLAGLLIGVGVLLLVGANWDLIPESLKIVVNFMIWAGVVYGIYWSFLNNKSKYREFFLTLAFLGVAATIGLTAQIFNLNGGLKSFAASWAVLGLVYVLPSRLISLNILWLFVALLPLDDVFIALLEPIAVMLEDRPITALVFYTILLSLLVYAGNKLYQECREKIVLPKAFAALMRFYMYSLVIVMAVVVNLDGGIFFYSPAGDLLAVNFWTFVFFGIRLALAAWHKNITSFTRNCYLTEIFIVFLFFSFYGNLLINGLGFIIGGLVILGLLFLMKKTSKYVKKYMEIFHE